MTRNALILLDHTGRGGTIPFINAYIRWLNQNDWSVYVNGQRVDNTLSPGDGMYSLVSIKSIRAAYMSQAADRTRFQVISSHSPKSLMFAILNRRKLEDREKIVSTMHWPVPLSWKTAAAKRHIFGKAGKHHAISNEVSDYLRDRLRVPSQKILRFNCYVDPDRFRPRNKSCNNIDGHIKLGYLGRLDEEKRVPFIVDYLRNNRDVASCVDVTVWGDGPLKQSLANQARRADVRIRFAGHTATPEEAFRQMDLNLLPSSIEGFPLSVVESGLCGVPTLRSDVEGAPEQISDGRNGFLFSNSGGARAFADRLSAILSAEVATRHSGRSFLREVGEASRCHFADLCGWKQFSDGCNALFNSPLSAGTRKK